METKKLSIHNGDKIIAFFYKKIIAQFDPFKWLVDYSVTEEEVNELEKGNIPERIDKLLENEHYIRAFKDYKILEDVGEDARFEKYKKAMGFILQAASKRYRNECLLHRDAGCPESILESLPLEKEDPQYRKVKSFLAVHGGYDIFLSAMSFGGDGELTVDYYVASALKSIFNRIGVKAFWWADNDISTQMQQWQIGTKIAIGLGMSKHYVGLAFEGGVGSYAPWLKDDRNLRGQTNYFRYELTTFRKLKGMNESIEAFFKDVLRFNKNHERLGIPAAGERILEFFSERELTNEDVENTPLDGNSSLECYQAKNRPRESGSIPRDFIRELINGCVFEGVKRNPEEIKRRLECVLFRLYQEFDCVKKAIDRNHPQYGMVLREKTRSNCSCFLSIVYILLSAILNAKLPALTFLPTSVKVLLPCLGVIPILIRLFFVKAFRIDPKATKVTVNGTISLIVAITLFLSYLVLLTESVVFFS